MQATYCDATRSAHISAASFDALMRATTPRAATAGRHHWESDGESIAITRLTDLSTLLITEPGVRQYYWRITFLAHDPSQCCEHCVDTVREAVLLADEPCDCGCHLPGIWPTFSCCECLPF